MPAEIAAAIKTTLITKNLTTSVGAIIPSLLTPNA